MGQLHVRENASRGKDPIVFIHGGAISGWMWQAHLEALPEFHCLAPDLPGHGSSAGIRPFSMDKTAELIAGLIRSHVSSGRASVVGYSVGVGVCVGLANKYPKLIARLLLGGPTPRLGPAAERILNLVLPPFISLASVKPVARLAARSMGATEDQMHLFQRDLAHVTPGLVREINALVASQPDPRSEEVPAVILVGEKEIPAAKKRACALARAYGQGSVHVVPGLGHAWPMQRPALFCDAIRQWMAGGQNMDGFDQLSASACGAA